MDFQSSKAEKLLVFILKAQGLEKTKGFEGSWLTILGPIGFRLLRLEKCNLKVEKFRGLRTDGRSETGPVFPHESQS